MIHKFVHSQPATDPYKENSMFFPSMLVSLGLVENPNEINSLLAIEYVADVKGEKTRFSAMLHPQCVNISFGTSSVILAVTTRPHTEASRTSPCGEVHNLEATVTLDYKGAPTGKSSWMLVAGEEKSPVEAKVIFLDLD